MMTSVFADGSVDASTFTLSFYVFSPNYSIMAELNLMPIVNCYLLLVISRPILALSAGPGDF